MGEGILTAFMWLVHVSQDFVHVEMLTFYLVADWSYSRTLAVSFSGLDKDSSAQH